MKQISKLQKQGQSLAEVTIAVSVTILIITGLIAGTTSSLKTSQFNRSRSISVKYAQEAMELSRKLRDAGWTTFQTYGSATGNTWCLDNDGLWLDVGTICDTASYLENRFARTVIFTWDSLNERMLVDVTVTWVDSNRDHSVSLSSILTKWR